MDDVAVVGAGIGGLTLARQLHLRGYRVRLFEKSSRVGGVISSIQKDGFLLECGPNSSLSKPGFEQVVDELGLMPSVIGPNPNARNRFLGKRDRSASLHLHPAPKSLPQALRTPLLSIPGKLSLLKEPFVRKTKQEDESVHSFITRRLSREIAEELVAPMLGGIWAADMHRLSCRSALPFLWQSEQVHGSLGKGLFKRLRSRKSQEARVTPHLLSFVDGMEVFPKALQASIPENCLHLNTAVQGVESKEHGFRVWLNEHRDCGEAFYDARHVVLATAARPAAVLLKDQAPALAAAVASIPYAPLGVLHLAYRETDVGHPLDGFGFLLSPTTSSCLLGAIFSSSLFPGRAPDGYHLITCFVGGMRNQDAFMVSDSRIQHQVISELSQFIQASGAPEVLHHHEWQQAIPNYALGHFKLQNAVTEFLEAQDGISILGNWYKGISVPDRVDEALNVAERICAKLESKEATANYSLAV